MGQSEITIDTNESAINLKEKLTEMQIRYCEALVLQGKTRKEAMKLAGSKAKEESLARQGYQYEQVEHVSNYIAWLRAQLQEELSISPHEVLYRLRKAYDLAEAKGDPKNMTDAATKIGMLGGFIEKDRKQSTNVQINNDVNPMSARKGSKDYTSVELEEDINRLSNLLLIDEGVDGN